MWEWILSMLVVDRDSSVAGQCFSSHMPFLTLLQTKVEVFGSFP